MISNDQRYWFYSFSCPIVRSAAPALPGASIVVSLTSWPRAETKRLRITGMTRIVQAMRGIAPSVMLLSAYASAGALAATGVPPRFAATIGNTLYYEGRGNDFRMFIYSTADGKFEILMKQSKADASSKWDSQTGYWKVEGDQLCRYPTRPPPPAERARICEPVSGFPSLGQQGTAMNGAMDVKLLPGKVAPPQ